MVPMRCRSWAVLLGACVAGILGCDDQQTYVKVNVAGNSAFTKVTLSLSINGQESKTFQNVTFSQTTLFKVGLAVPASLTGAISVAGDASSGSCVVGMGGPVFADAHAAETGDGVALTINAVSGCPGMDAGMDLRVGGGTGGTGGTVLPGTGGRTGTGGTGAPGSGGAGVAGHPGSGGVRGTGGGIGGTGGMIGPGSGGIVG